MKKQEKLRTRQMFWTAAQMQNFFVTQMEIPLASIPSLTTEGIVGVVDLGEFDKDTIITIASDFCRRIPPVVLGAKS